MKRREILKTLTILPLAGTIGNSGSLVQSVQAASKPKRDLFKEFGLQTFINAAGYYTSLSGSLMQHTAMDAIQDTSLQFCRLEAVQDKVGAKIAGLLHAESAMVTAGAFSALMLGMAGVLSGKDPKKVSQIPILEGTGMKTELLPLPLINRIPALNISWDKTKIKLDNLQASLKSGNPSIEVMGGSEGSINVTTHMLKAHEVSIVATKIREELSKAQI